MTPLEEALIQAGVAYDKAKQVAELVSNDESIDVLRGYAMRRQLRLLQVLMGICTLCTLALLGVVTASAHCI